MQNAKLTQHDKSGHERYVALCRLVEKRDELLATLFDHPRRSTALFQLAHIHAERLLTDEEFASFSDELRASVQLILSLGSTS